MNRVIQVLWLPILSNFFSLREVIGIGRPGRLRFMGSQRVGHDWATELNWLNWREVIILYCYALQLFHGYNIRIINNTGLYYDIKSHDGSISDTILEKRLSILKKGWKPGTHLIRIYYLKRNTVFPGWASLIAQFVKNPPAMWETWVQSLGWEDPLGKGKATHSSILARKSQKESDTTEWQSLPSYSLVR